LLYENDGEGAAQSENRLGTTNALNAHKNNPTREISPFHQHPRHRPSPAMSDATVSPSKWVSEASEKTTTLPPKAQLETARREAKIRQAIQQYPNRWRRFYHLLFRQLTMPDDAVKQALAQAREALKKKKEGEEKATEPISAPTAPPVVPSAKSPCDHGKPSAEDTRDPPAPPTSSKPQQGTKRGALQAFGAKSESGSGFEPCVGDWRCGRCKWWNFRHWSFCHGKGGKCKLQLRSSTVNHHVQEEAPGIKQRVTGAKRFADWQCECKVWNREHWGRCWKCRKGRAVCSWGVDVADWLPGKDESDEEYHPPEDGVKALLYGDSQGTSGGSTSGRYHSMMAGHYGVKGKFKEKKNKYYER